MAAGISWNAGAAPGQGREEVFCKTLKAKSFHLSQISDTFRIVLGFFFQGGEQC